MYLLAVKCPFCGADEDRVVDSRLAEDGIAIRRRRECAGCTNRFTTFERIEEPGMVVIKRSGDREQFDREKIVLGLRAACKNRPVEDVAVAHLAAAVEEEMRVLGRDVTSAEVGIATLEHLRRFDEVAYVRFASVYKGFEDADDFARELRTIVKTTAPKSKS
jgi:transcriptional repressor NrdR